MKLMICSVRTGGCGLVGTDLVEFHNGICMSCGDDRAHELRRDNVEELAHAGNKELAWVLACEDSSVVGRAPHFDHGECKGQLCGRDVAYARARYARGMSNLQLQQPLSTSAEELLKLYRDDTDLPDMDTFLRMTHGIISIPVEFREFILIFPRAVFIGHFEEDGSSKITDDEIGMLKWDGSAWKASELLAGKRGWFHGGPDICGPNARIVRFKDCSV